MRRLTSLIIAVTLLTTAACSGGGDKKADGPKSSTTPKETTTTLPPKLPAPLTGEEVDRAVAERPAVAVKVDNTKSGRPQAGLDQADVIFEERVEGGVTRLVAIFQSKDADLVGPLRSIRPTDPTLIWPFGGVFAFSDGVPQVVGLMKDIPVRAVYEMQGAGPFTYPSGRKRPYKTFAATGRLRQEADKSATAPPPFAKFLAPGDPVPAGDGPVAAATVTFGPTTTSAVQWDATTGRWLKTGNGVPQTLTSGARLSFVNVIIQFVPYTSAGYRDVTGSTVDKANLVGAGDAVLLFNGQKKALRWSKPNDGAMTAFTDAAGAPIALRPGPTLVLLPAPGTPIAVS